MSNETSDTCKADGNNRIDLGVNIFSNQIWGPKTEMSYHVFEAIGTVSMSDEMSLTGVLSVLLFT